MGFLNTFNRIISSLTAAAAEQNFNEMKKKEIMSNEDLELFKKLTTELKEIKTAHNQYVSNENRKEKTIKKATANTELSEEEKERIIEKAQEEFDRFENSFFQSGGGSKYGDKFDMLQQMNEITKEIFELQKSYKS
jgi:hypothetical protein